MLSYLYSKLFLYLEFNSYQNIIENQFNNLFTLILVNLPFTSLIGFCSYLLFFIHSCYLKLINYIKNMNNLTICEKQEKLNYSIRFLP